MAANSGALAVKDLASYTVYELYAAGMRVAGDYTAADAIEHYLELHPDASEPDVRAELQREIATEAP